MKKNVAIALFLSVSLAFAVPVARANGLEIDFVVVQYPSLEYDNFVGLFNSALIEELKKTDGQGFTPARWMLSISLVPPRNKEVKIEIVRYGAKDPALVAVLKENASFISINAVAKHVVEIVQRGGAE